MASLPPAHQSDTLSRAAQLIHHCVALGVTDFVIAPGSRSAPLTAAVASNPNVRALLIYDERSAGHIALGMAQQLGRPVALICTSGTAAVNFGPAVVEAFYQQLPLLVLTADRPSEWIDQEDNQAIRQNALFGRHAKAAYTLPLSDSHADAAWHLRRTLADAVQVATAQPQGPVQINIPLREPLYAATLPDAVNVPRPARAVSTVAQVAEREWSDLLTTWRAAKRKLIVAGQHPVDGDLAASLQRLLAFDPNVALVADVTANLPHASAPLARWDALLAGADDGLLDALAPDLVLTVGGQLTSKALKSFLRKRPPATLWRVSPLLPAPDTYQRLTHVIPTPAAPFVGALVERLETESPAAHSHELGYAKEWADATARVSSALDAAMSALPWSEVAAVSHLLHALPPDCALQLGNSLPIRYVNLLGLAHGHTPLSVHANRGASGIDGVVSTAVGAAIARAAEDRLTLLIVGDLSFLYDRNGLWHRHLPPTLRIVLLNNHGGGIFDVIAGPDQLPADLRRDFFLTPQPLTARRTAADANLRYLHVSTAADLHTALPEFLNSHAGAALLEIETDMAANSAAYRALLRATRSPNPA